MSLRTASLMLAAVVAASALAGCAPLLIGGAAVGTVLVAQDRRTSGAQIDDEAIELRSASRLREAFGKTAHINVNSYNRQVLLTGEVPNEAFRQQAEVIVARVDGVSGVVNELAVMPMSSLAQRSNDLLVTGKVKASFVDAADLQANTVKVVTERGTVYLMGRVTPREAERATAIARAVGGVQKVVRIFEPLDPGQPLTTMAPAPVAPATVAPAGAAPAPQPQAGGVVVTPIR